MEIIEINDSGGYISALVFDKESDSYYFLFGNGKWSMTCNSEYYPYSTFLPKKDASIVFDIIEKNGKLFQMIELNNKDSYSDMRRLLEIINEDS